MVFNPDDLNTIPPSSRWALRKILSDDYDDSDSTWVIMYKSISGFYTDQYYCTDEEAAVELLYKLIKYDTMTPR